MVETTDTPYYKNSETILDHLVGGQVKQRLSRTDYLEQYRIFMDKMDFYVTDQNQAIRMYDAIICE
ncbi:integrase [Bartonella sp. AD13SXNS]|uniref:integrase n=1 Tax=Bartonella sp. AD13SXNS TaxID=3243462 RepID=UPI0035CF4ED0